MTEQAKESLLSALRKHTEARSEAEVELAVLSLQESLDGAMRAYLADHWHGDTDHREVNFPQLVDLVRDHTDLFENDPSLPPLLVSLNTTRIKIAHPGEDKPSPRKITRDADKLASLIRPFWPKLFLEAFPEWLVAVPVKSSTERPGTPEPPPVLPEYEPAPPQPVVDRRQRLPVWPKVRRFLRRLWSDENAPRFQKRLFLKRVIGFVAFFILARLCKDAAIFTVRWPEPLKYAGIALFIFAMGLFVWGLILLWKVLRQLRLRGLLIVFVVAYVVLLSVKVLTSDSPLPWHQEAWRATRDWAASTGRAARDVGESIVKAPEEFRVAYTGHRRPVRLPGMDADDPAYLTPIPANRPARLSAGAEQTANPSEPAPTIPETVGTLECPYTQARLTAPLDDQVVKGQVQVEGTADIPDFDYYKFEYRREDGDVPDGWHWVARFERPVEAGVLGIWDVSSLPEGVYTFRLTVVNREGNYPFPPCDVRVQIRRR